jgi:uncharacterized protein involved in exopolysaccharide biosynthesis
MQVNLQKEKVLSLNLLRDNMSVLEKDVETAKKAMDAAALRFSQTSIEGQSNQSDIEILNPASPPLSPSSPILIINIILATLMGGILGMGFGLMAEFSDRRVRSSQDIASALRLSVLGVVESLPPVAPKKLLTNRIQKLLPQ